jgi:hypothetical protein
MIDAAWSAGCDPAVSPSRGAHSRALTRASPFNMRSRGGPSGKISFNRPTTLLGVKSRCTSSGTISSPAIKLTMAKYGTLILDLPKR